MLALIQTSSGCRQVSVLGESQLAKSNTSPAALRALLSSKVMSKQELHVKGFGTEIHEENNF